MEIIYVVFVTRERYVYLMSRMPTPINSNYYVLDFASWCPTSRQTSRLAHVVFATSLLESKTLLYLYAEAELLGVL